MLRPLGGSRLKIERANQHIDNLNGILEAFTKADFYSLGVQKDLMGHYVLKFEVTKSLPNIAPTVGDAVHNLRASLDLAACEIVRIGGGTPNRNTKFPFRKDRKELVNAINGGTIKTAGADIVDFIVDTVKPYKGGNDALIGLHYIDIMDKHVNMIPVLSVYELVNVNGRMGNCIISNSTFAVRGGGVVDTISMTEKVEFEGHGEPRFRILFGKGKVFEGQPIIPTLHQLSHLVSGILDAIEKIILSRPI